jgi:hypothetical protein
MLGADGQEEFRISDREEMSSVLNVGVEFVFC